MIDENNDLFFRKGSYDFIETSIDTIGSDDSIVAREIQLLRMEKSTLEQRLQIIRKSIKTSDIHMFSTAFGIFCQGEIGADRIGIWPTMRKKQDAIRFRYDVFQSMKFGVKILHNRCITPKNPCIKPKIFPSIASLPYQLLVLSYLFQRRFSGVVSYGVFYKDVFEFSAVLS